MAIADPQALDSLSRMTFIDAAEAPVYRPAATLSPGVDGLEARVEFQRQDRLNLDRTGQAHRLLEAGPAGSGRRYLRLLSGLYDDASAVPDLDVQVVPVQEQHAHQGSAARRVGLDVAQLTVP